MKKKSTEKRSKLFGRPDALLVEEGVAGGSTPPPIEVDSELRPGRRRPRPLAESAPSEPAPPPIRIDTSGAYGPLVADDDEEVLATEEDDGSSDEDSFSASAADTIAADEADTVLDMGVRPRPLPPGDRSGLRLQATARPAARPQVDNDDFNLGDIVETVRTRTAPVRQEEEPPGEVMEFDAGVLDEGYESADSVFAQAQASRIPLATARSAPGPIPDDLPGLRGERTATAPATAPPRRIQPTLAPAPDFFPEPSTSPKPLPPRLAPAPSRASPPPPARAEQPRVEPARAEPPRVAAVRREPVRAEPAADVLRAPPRPGPPHPATQRAGSLPSPMAHTPPRPPEPPPRAVSATSADGIALLGFGVLVGLMISGGGLWAWSKFAPESAPLRLTTQPTTEAGPADAPGSTTGATPEGASPTDAAVGAAPVAVGEAPPTATTADPATAAAATATTPDPKAADPTAVASAEADTKAAATMAADPKATDPKATNATAADTKATNATAADPKAADTKATAAKTTAKAADAKTADTKASTAKTTATRAETPPPAQVGRIPASASSVVESGYLRVQSDSKCLVIVDGRQRGYAPDLGLIELPQGEHQLKCVVPGSGTSRSMTVRVDAGTLRAVQLTFAK